jgi:hypothetical protein
LKTEIFDMVVLSVGLQVSAKTKALAEKLDIQLNADGFCQTTSFSPISTTREGIYVSGAFQGPKNIPTSVVDASAASAAAGEILSPARHSQTRVKEQIPERSVFGERPKIGVFVCKCGSNIAGVVDVPAVTDYAATLPHVDYAEYNLYTCSQNTQEDITQVIKEKGLKIRFCKGTAGRQPVFPISGFFGQGSCDFFRITLKTTVQDCRQKTEQRIHTVCPDQVGGMGKGTLLPSHHRHRRLLFKQRCFHGRLRLDGQGFGRTVSARSLKDAQGRGKSNGCCY